MFGGLNLAELGQHAEQLKTLVTGVLNSVQSNEAAVTALRESNVKQTETLARLVSVISDLHFAVESLKAPVDLGEVAGSGNSSQAPDDSVRAEG